MERAGNLDRRTLEPSPPPVRPAAGVYHSFQHAPFSRGRGFRGGFRGGYSGRYERGEFTEFSQVCWSMFFGKHNCIGNLM